MKRATKPYTDYWMKQNDGWLQSQSTLAVYCHTNNLDYNEFVQARRILKNSGFIPDYTPVKFNPWRYYNVKHMLDEKLLFKDYYRGEIQMSLFERRLAKLNAKYKPLVDERIEQLWNPDS